MAGYTDQHVKAWEALLQNDAKSHFLKNWERLGKRFGKKELLECFSDGFEYFWQLWRGGGAFKESFESKVSNPLKDKSNTNFFKWIATYNPLMSLYGKFIFLRDYYGESFLQTFDAVSPKVGREAKNIKTKAKQKLTKNLKGTTDSNHEKEEEKNSLIKKIWKLESEKQDWIEINEDIDGGYADLDQKISELNQEIAKLEAILDKID